MTSCDTLTLCDETQVSYDHAYHRVGWCLVHAAFGTTDTLCYPECVVVRDRIFQDKLTQHLPHVSLVMHCRACFERTTEEDSRVCEFCDERCCDDCVQGEVCEHYNCHYCEICPLCMPSATLCDGTTVGQSHFVGSLDHSLAVCQRHLKFCWNDEEENPDECEPSKDLTLYNILHKQEFGWN